MPDIVDDIESLFNQILGKFNANRPTNSKSRKDVKSGSRLSSESVGALSTTEQPRADNSNQSSQNTTGNISTDETNNGNNQTEKSNQVGIDSSLLDKPFTLQSGLDKLLVNADSYSANLSKRFAQLIPDIKIEIVSDISRLDKQVQSDVLAGGMFYPKTNTIIINPKTDDWQSSLIELINHELSHAVTSHVIGFDNVESKLTEVQLRQADEIRDKLGNLLQSDVFSEQVQDRLSYAWFKDYPHELVSIFTAETQVRKELKAVDSNAFKEINDFIKSLIEVYNNEQRNENRNITDDQTGIGAEISNIDTGTTAEQSESITSNPTSQDNIRGMESNQTNQSSDTQKPTKINNPEEFVDELLSNVTKADKSQIELLNYLLPKLVSSTGLQFEWVNKLTHEGKEVYGLYFPDSNVIQLSTSKWKDLSDFDKVALVLHESIHALTEQSIDNPNKEQQQAIQVLQDMRKQLIKKTQDKDILKRLVNIHEFIAYGLTDKMFMNFITDNLDTSTIPLAKKIVNGLGEFFKQVLDLFDWFKKDVKSNKDKQAIYKTFVNHSMSLVKAIENPNNTDMVSEPRASEFNADNVVNEKTAVAVLQDMPTSVSDKFNNHLDKLLDNVAQFYAYNSTNKRTVDRAIKRESNRNLVAWFGLDTKQSHAFEVMKAVIAEYINNQTGTVAVNDMRKIYQESKEQLSYEDFLSANPTDLEIQLAKQTFDRLFDSRNGKDYLANFVALSLTSEKFNQVLDKKRQHIKRDVNRPLFDRLMRVFDTVVNFFTGLYLHQNGNVNQQLLKLTNRLSKIDSNARNEQASILQTTWEWVGKGFNPVNTAIHQSVAFVMRKLYHSNSMVGETIATPFIMAEDLKQSKSNVSVAEVFSEYVGAKGKRFGEIRNAINETFNSNNITRFMEKMVRSTQKVAQTRQQIKTALQKQMLSQFNNKALSEQERSALTDVVMRSDLGGLLQHLNMAGVMTMATNKTKRNERIKLLEQRILQHKMGNDMLMQAKSLSAYMTHGVTPKHLVKSSEAIALQAGIEVNDISKLNQALYQDIDILVSLYALNNLGNDVQTTFDFLVLDERKAIENIIKQHADVVKQSKAEFKHNPLSYIKGYSPDIVNPYRSLKWVHADEVADLQRQGWEVVTDDLTQDNLDKTDKRVLMYHQDINYQRRVSGALDTADSHSKGTVVYNEYDVMDLQRVVQERHRERMARSQLSYQNFNPFKETGGLVMNISPDSYVIDVHYEMQGFIKDKWLERNNDIFDLLPTMASNLQFKEDIKNQRAILAKVIHKDYLNSYAKDPKLFVVIDPESLDPKVQEDYALMPYDFRQEMKKYFGNKPIVVRSSVYNTVFGYKAWSIGKMFDKTFGKRSAFEKQFVKLFEKILGDKAQSRVVQIERVVQFITTMAKDVIVVRSGKVLLGNIIANLLLLGMNGVRPDVIIKDMLFAWREGQRYGKLQNRLYEIEFALKSARGDERKVLNQERHEIVVDMDKHPMRDYMNAGMMSTIVEDTVIFKDKPDFINIYEEKVKKVTDKIPKPMKDTFDWIVINPNTPVYQFLADATQFSDFGAKYVLAKHLQSKGMSFDRAISEAQESFINYDVPTGQGLDYMNRMGLFMFTKFFLRFQKVLARLFKDKPAQLLVQHQLLENGFDMQGILDPAMPLRFGNNPFEASAFNIFGTGDDLMTYQVISGAF